MPDHTMLVKSYGSEAIRPSGEVGELQLLCWMCCQAAFELFMSIPID